MKKEIGRTEFLSLLKGKFKKENLIRIEDAYNLSKYGHRTQLRDQGGRYFEHPKSVALILIKELNIFDRDLIIMALLHDIIEDTYLLSQKAIDKLFGKRVTSGLDYLTKTKSKEIYVKKLGKCNDVGVLIVKFADRLHNLRTLDGLNKEKIINKHNETKDLYLPMLDRGILKANKIQKSQLLYLKDNIIKIIY